MTLFLTSAVFLFLVLRFCVVLFNYLSRPKLPAAPRNYYDMISILIPSYRDEAQLECLLRSIREQKTDNYEVLIAGDDRSGEASAALARLVAAAGGEDPRFRVMGISCSGATGIEATGHYGKRCQRLAAVARGDYLLFLQDISYMDPELLFDSLYRMKRHSLSLLSLFAAQRDDTFWGKQLSGLFSYFALCSFPLRLTLLARHKNLVQASAQFMLFKAQPYNAFQWHAGIAEMASAGIPVMKKVKSLGLRVESLFAVTRLSGSAYGGAQPFARFRNDLLNLAQGSRSLLLLFLLLCCLAFAWLLPLLSMQLIGMALTLLLGMRLMTSLLAGQPAWRNLLFHPLQIVLLALMIISSCFPFMRKKS